MKLAETAITKSELFNPIYYFIIYSIFYSDADKEDQPETISTEFVKSESTDLNRINQQQKITQFIQSNIENMPVLKDEQPEGEMYEEWTEQQHFGFEERRLQIACKFLNFDILDDYCFTSCEKFSFLNCVTQYYNLSVSLI